MSTITSNLNATFNAIRLQHNHDLLSKSLGRLSSGSTISTPADNPTGVGSAGKMDSENVRLQAALDNVQNGVSYTQTADSLMGDMATMVSRMSELTTLAQDPTKSPSDVSNYQQEFSALQTQLRSIIGGTTAEIGGTTDINNPTGSFNGVNLFGPASGVSLSIGANAGQSLTIGTTNLRTGSMLSLIQQNGSGAFSLSVTDPTAQAATNGVLDQLGTARADIGAAQSRLDLVSSHLTVEKENLQSALSQIQDVDVASESTQLAKYNILVQSSTAMLAQANQTPQSVLKLLQR